jgi:hypothetical protein
MAKKLSSLSEQLVTLTFATPSRRTALRQTARLTVRENWRKFRSPPGIYAPFSPSRKAHYRVGGLDVMTSPQFRLRVSPRRDARAVNLSFVPAVAHHEFRRFGLLRGLRSEVQPAHALIQVLFYPRAGP